MNKHSIFTLASLSLISVLSACSGGGGGGDEPAPTPTPPAISKPASVTKISPTSAVIGTPTQFTIAGKHFTDKLKVTLTGATCQAGNLVSATEYKISCQHDKAEALNMVVKDGDKELKTQAITFAAPPASVTNITPTSAVIGIQTQFTIAGNHFTDKLTVTLTGATCQAGKLVSATEYKLSCQHDKAEALNMVVKEDDKELKTQAIQFILPAPQNVQATKASADSINVTWQSAQGATTYNVYYANESFKDKTVDDYSQLAGGTHMQIPSGNTTTLTGLDKTKKYYIVVTSQAGIVESAKSNEAEVNLDPIIRKPSSLNDTGIRLCGSADASDNQVDCETATANASGTNAPLGQDGHYGTGKNGSRGMVFSKVKTFEDQCVQDAHTGLMWEVKQTTAGLHHKDNTYTWYNTNNATNGGNAGRQNGGICQGGSDCDTDAFVKAVNAAGAGWCGYHDWRLPTHKELKSIVDYSKTKPAIDPIFLNIANEWYWSASPDVDLKFNAWLVDFAEGGNQSYYKSERYRVLLVRGK